MTDDTSKQIQLNAISFLITECNGFNKYQGIQYKNIHSNCNVIQSALIVYVKQKTLWCLKQTIQEFSHSNVLQKHGDANIVVPLSEYIY